MQYVDTLARDLGIKTNRKSNVFSEMFVPYRPSDYNGLLGEFYAAEKKRNLQKATSDSASSSVKTV
jgi:dimethylaniline monooxygenase (N-oxide forming)